MNPGLKAENKNTVKISRIIFLTLLLVLIFMIFSAPIRCPDFWWHLKTGEYIYQTRSLLKTDPFSYTSFLKDADSLEYKSIKFKLTQYWLAQLIFYCIYHYFDLQGIIYLRALILTSILFLIYRIVRKEGLSFCLSIALLLISAVSFYDYKDERPQLFSFLCTFTLVYLLEGFRKKSMAAASQPPDSRHSFPAHLFLIPLIMILWANLHGGFIVGIILILGYILSEIFKYFTKRFGPALPYGVLKLLTIIGMISILFSLINPNGYNVISLLLEHRKSFDTAQVVEWMSPFQQFRLGFIKPGLILYFILLFLGISLFFMNRKRLDLTDMTTFSILAAITLSGTRFIPLFTPVAAFMIARYGSMIMKASPYKVCSSAVARKIALVLSILLSTVLVLLLIMGSNLKGLFHKGGLSAIAENNYPEGAVRFLKSQKMPENMFNPYGWGGYLIWALYPDYKVFIDGRGLTERAFFDEIKIMSASSKSFENLPEWKALLKLYNVNFIITFSVDKFTGLLVPLIPALLSDPEWHLVYMDRISLIFLRESPEAIELIKKFEIPKEWLWNEVITEAALKAMHSLSRNIRINYYVTIGDAFFAKKNYDEAKTAYSNALKLGPENIAVRKRFDIFNNY